MNYIYRCLLSLKRNLSKLFPMFLIASILGNILCSAVAIRQSTLQTKEQFEKSYGTKITFDFNNGYDQHLYESKTNQYKRISTLFQNLNAQNIYSYSNIYYVSNLFFSDNLKYEENNSQYFKENSMNLYLWGTSNSILINEKEYEIELINGRHFTKNELNETSRTVIVSENFKIKENNEIRNVQIGDLITVDSCIYSNGTIIHKESKLFEVVGIYKRTEYVQNNEKGYSINNNLTEIYIPLTTLNKLLIQYNELCREYNVVGNYQALSARAYFQLKNNELDDEFMNLYHQILDDNYTAPYGFEMKSSNEIYEKIGTPIESLSNIADYILLTSVILTILILCLTIFIILRNRKHEIGILYSLGERKVKIILQFVIEIYLIVILALSLSTFTGCKLGEIYSNILIDDDTEIVIDEYSKNDLIDLYKVEYSKEYIFGVLGIGSIIIVTSSTLPIIYILQLNPKKILL